MRSTLLVDHGHVDALGEQDLVHDLSETAEADHQHAARQLPVWLAGRPKSGCGSGDARDALEDDVEHLGRNGPEQHGQRRERGDELRRAPAA